MNEERREVYKNLLAKVDVIEVDFDESYEEDDEQEEIWKT